MTLENDPIDITRQTSAISVTKSSGTQVVIISIPSLKSMRISCLLVLSKIGTSIDSLMKILS